MAEQQQQKVAATASPAAGPAEASAAKEEFPMWTIFVIGFILMALSVTVVFLIIRPYTEGPSVRLETWEYWQGRFHLKIKYNTTGGSTASRNALDAGNGCMIGVNSTPIIGEVAFSSFATNLTHRPEPIIKQNTFIAKTNATIETAISSIRAFYCAQKAYVLTATKNCDFEMTEIGCDI